MKPFSVTRRGVPLALCAAALVLTSGCVDESPLKVIGIFPAPNNCQMMSTQTTQIAGGSLNIGSTGEYRLLISVENDIDIAQLTNGNVSGKANDINAGSIAIDEVVLEYTSIPKIDFDKEAIGLAAVALPGAMTPIQINMSILGSKGFQKLSDFITAGDDPVDLNIRFYFHGKQVADGSEIKSSPIDYPVQVFKTNIPDCGKDAQGNQIPLGGTGPCGDPGGQDGAPVCCSNDANCKALQ